MIVTHRAFRFGVAFGLQNTQTLQNWRDLARKTEDLGYATLLLLDHPMLVAPIPALMAAAYPAFRPMLITLGFAA